MKEQTLLCLFLWGLFGNTQLARAQRRRRAWYDQHRLTQHSLSTGAGHRRALSANGGSLDPEDYSEDEDDKEHALHGAKGPPTPPRQRAFASAHASAAQQYNACLPDRSHYEHTPGSAAPAEEGRLVAGQQQEQEQGSTAPSWKMARALQGELEANKRELAAHRARSDKLERVRRHSLPALLPSRRLLSPCRVLRRTNAYCAAPCLLPVYKILTQM